MKLSKPAISFKFKRALIICFSLAAMVVAGVILDRKIADTRASSELTRYLSKRSLKPLTYPTPKITREVMTNIYDYRFPFVDIDDRRKIYELRFYVHSFGGIERHKLVEPLNAD